MDLNKHWQNMTDIDAEILARSLAIPSELLTADDTDYRVILDRVKEIKLVIHTASVNGIDAEAVACALDVRRDVAVLAEAGISL